MKEKPFYKVDKEFAAELGMGLNTFKAAKKLLRDGGWIDVVRMGSPAKSHYVMNVEFTLTSLRDFNQVKAEIQPTDGGDSANQLAEKPQSLLIHRLPTEITIDYQRVLPDFLGKTPIARLANVYSLRYKELYGIDYRITNWPMMTKLFKPLLASESEWQIAALILLHFDWAGTSGEDDFTHRRLSERCFPLEWVPKAYNEYRAYLQNSLGVQYEDPEAIKKWVVDIIKPLYKKQHGGTG